MSDPGGLRVRASLRSAMAQRAGGMSCSFCRNPEVDSFETEAGNNAEFPVEVKLCEEHFREYEMDEYALLSKHAAQIDDMAYERLIDQADMMRDDG